MRSTSLPSISFAPTSANVKRKQDHLIRRILLITGHESGASSGDHAARIRDAAGADIEVRIGMHVGPAGAGVVGLKKFIYDVWGDTVNTASRMESTGVPGRLQATTETRERLGETFELERRGIVEVKGKGPIETWFVVGRR